MNLVIDSNGLVSLNHIAKLAGVSRNKEPGRWLRNAGTEELIMHLKRINPREPNWPTERINSLKW